MAKDLSYLTHCPFKWSLQWLNKVDTYRYQQETTGLNISVPAVFSHLLASEPALLAKYASTPKDFASSLIKGNLPNLNPSKPKEIYSKNYSVIINFETKFPFFKTQNLHWIKPKGM